jgi:hypothetical protein
MICTVRLGEESRLLEMLGTTGELKDSRLSKDKRIMLPL